LFPLQGIELSGDSWCGLFCLSGSGSFLQASDVIVSGISADSGTFLGIRDGRAVIANSSFAGMLHMFNSAQPLTNSIF